MRKRSSRITIPGDVERRKRLAALLPYDAPTPERRDALSRARWAAIAMAEACHVLADPGRRSDSLLVKRVARVANEVWQSVEGEAPSTRATRDLIWAIAQASKELLRGGPDAQFLADTAARRFSDSWPAHGAALDVQAFRSAAAEWAAAERHSPRDTMDSAPRGGRRRPAKGRGVGRVPSMWPEVCVAIESAGLGKRKPESVRKIWERDERSA